MTIGQGRITCHEINPPLGEGFDGHHKMKGGRMSTQPMSEDLKRMTFLDRIHTMFKDRRLEISNAQYFYGQWPTQRDDHHMPPHGSHSELFQLPHG
jgi:hypothetical protein